MRVRSHSAGVKKAAARRRRGLVYVLPDKAIAADLLAAVETCWPTDTYFFW
jgi:hypothetical protein